MPDNATSCGMAKRFFDREDSDTLSALDMLLDTDVARTCEFWVLGKSVEEANKIAEKLGDYGRVTENLREPTGSPAASVTSSCQSPPSDILPFRSKTVWPPCTSSVSACMTDSAGTGIQTAANTKDRPLQRL